MARSVSAVGVLVSCSGWRIVISPIIRLEFPVLLGFCDARSGRPFHPFHRYPGSPAQTWRCPFHRCRVASAQASTPDPESLPATRATSFYTPTVASQLRKYLTLRSKALAGRHVKAFFMNRYGKHLNYNAQRLTFLRLLNSAGIQAVPGQRGPSLHSFRHSFAVRRLTLWHRERRDVQELLPHLAVYLAPRWPKKYLLVSKRHSLTLALAQLLLV